VTAAVAFLVLICAFVRIAAGGLTDYANPRKGIEAAGSHLPTTSILPYKGPFYSQHVLAARWFASPSDPQIRLQSNPEA
jgi:hypothetical protein